MTHPIFGWYGKQAGNWSPWTNAFSRLLLGKFLNAAKKKFIISYLFPFLVLLAGQLGPPLLSKAFS